MDHEKIPTSIAHFIVHRQIMIVSRYRKADEFEIMTRMADRILSVEGYGCCVLELFCDSKAGHCYSVICFTDVPRRVCMAIAKKAEEVAMDMSPHGHNGIHVYRGGWLEDCQGELDPDWGDEGIEDAG